jgi:hypothetical protein
MKYVLYLILAVIGVFAVSVIQGAREQSARDEEDKHVRVCCYANDVENASRVLEIYLRKHHYFQPVGDYHAIGNSLTEVDGRTYQTGEKTYERGFTTLVVSLPRTGGPGSRRTLKKALVAKYIADNDWYLDIVVKGDTSERFTKTW